MAVSLVSFAGFTVSAFCHITLEPTRIPSRISDKAGNSLLELRVNTTTTTSSTYLKKSAFTEAGSSTFGWTFIRNTFTHRNLLIFIFTNFLQVFSSTFSLIFMDIFFTRLLKHITVGYRALVLFVSFFSPVLMNIIISPIVGKRDVYPVGYKLQDFTFDCCNV